MKPNSGFVVAMLTLCSVATVTAIEPSQITADHLRLMDKSMTTELKELILELATLADEEGKSVTRLSTEDVFALAGLDKISSEEAALVCCSYSSQGRGMHITNDHIMVCPSRKVLADSRRKELRENVIA